MNHRTMQKSRMLLGVLLQQQIGRIFSSKTSSTWYAACVGKQPLQKEIQNAYERLYDSYMKKVGLIKLIITQSIPPLSRIYHWAWAIKISLLKSSTTTLLIF